MRFANQDEHNGSWPSRWRTLVAGFAVVVSSMCMSIGCGDSPPESKCSAKYVVSLGDSSDEKHFGIVAELRIGPGIDSLEVGSYLQGETNAIQNFVARDEHGSILSSIQSVRKFRHEWVEFRYVTYKIPRPPSGRVVINYEGRLGLREGVPLVTGYTGQLYGFASRHWAVFSLAQVLLMPKPSSLISNMRVEYSVPPGWKIVSPWHRFERSKSNIEELFYSPVVVGEFDLVEYKDLHLSLAILGEPKTVEGQNRLAQTCREYFASIRSLWNYQNNDPYLIVLAPLLGASRFEAFVEPTQYGCVVSYEGGEPVHPRSMAYYIMRRFAEEVGLKEKISNKRDKWFINGLMGYFSRKALVSLNPKEIDRNDADIVDNYVSAIVDGEFSVATVSHREETTESQQSYKSVAVVDRLNQWVLDFTNAEDSLDSFLPILAKRESIADLQDVLDAHYGFDFSYFFDRYVYGSEFLPYKWIQTSSERTELESEEGTAQAITDSIAVIVVYDGESFLETCGCKVSEFGGMARLGSWLKMFRRNFPGPVILLSIGNAFPRDKTQMELDHRAYQELRLYLSLMEKVGFDCAVIGESELLYGPEAFLEQTEGLSFPFVSANVSHGDRWLAKRFQRFSRQGLKVDVIGLTPKMRWISDRVWRARTAGLDFHSSVQAVGRISHELGARSGHIQIVGGRIKPDVARTIAEMYPDIQVIVSHDNACFCSDGGERVLHDYSGFHDKVLLLYPLLGNYGVTTFVLHRNEQGAIVKFREWHTFLGDNIPDDPFVRSAIDSFYSVMQNTGRKDRTPRISLWLDRIKMGYSYVGAEACQACHEDKYQHWIETDHAYAFKTLLRMHRHYDLDCAVCHVTGGGQPSGYEYGNPGSSMRNVQCEGCHGPGSAHSESNTRGHIVKVPTMEVCMACHEHEHSKMDSVNFSRYYNKIKH